MGWRRFVPLPVCKTGVRNQDCSQPLQGTSLSQSIAGTWAEQRRQSSSALQGGSALHYEGQAHLSSLTLCLGIWKVLNCSGASQITFSVSGVTSSLGGNALPCIHPEALIRGLQIIWFCINNSPEGWGRLSHPSLEPHQGVVSALLPAEPTDLHFPSPL